MTAGCQPSSKRRRALRRDQRLRAMHLAQASEPSFASAPHAGPRRHPGRPERSIICSPSSHQCRSSLLSGDTRARSTTARIPSAPGTFVPAGLPCFHSTGLGSPASCLLFLAHPLCSSFISGASPQPANHNTGGHVAPVSLYFSRRADRLWPPSFRVPAVKPARAVSVTVRRGPGLMWLRAEHAVHDLPAGRREIVIPFFAERLN